VATVVPLPLCARHLVNTLHAVHGQLQCLRLAHDFQYEMTQRPIEGEHQVTAAAAAGLGSIVLGGFGVFL